MVRAGASIFAFLAACACSGTPAAPPPTTTSTVRGAPPIVSGPPTFEAWIEANRLQHAPPALWASASSSLAGTRVRWPVASWGGEATTATFEAPDGWRGTERTRFVSRGLTNLGGVDAAGSIVIVCPHVIDSGAAEIVLEGTVLGVVDRGGPELWLGHCVVSR